MAGRSSSSVCESAAEAADCQILFIHQSEERRLGEALSSLGHRSTLTVSDLPGAAQRGVMIRLVTEQGRVRLRVNVDSARAAAAHHQFQPVARGRDRRRNPVAGRMNGPDIPSAAR